MYLEDLPRWTLSVSESEASVASHRERTWSLEREGESAKRTPPLCRPSHKACRRERGEDGGAPVSLIHAPEVRGESGGSRIGKGIGYSGGFRRERCEGRGGRIKRRK
jgi:hypothetical protein